jgi:hypothetical protein
MVRSLWVAGGLMLLLPTVHGQDADKTAREISTLIGEYEKASAEFLKALKAATTPEERKELLKQRPNAVAYAAKLMALAEKDAKAPAAGQAFAWIASNAGTSKDGKAALGRLLEHHAANPAIGAALERLAGLADPSIEKFLEQVVRENPSKDTKGLATYALAKRYLSQADRGGRTLKQDQIDALNQKAEKLLLAVKNEFASVKTSDGTLGDNIKNELFVLQHLVVGKVALDIVGEDTDGKQFKLSDYRGKVVMLDFWGHW